MLVRKTDSWPPKEAEARDLSHESVHSKTIKRNPTIMERLYKNKIDSTAYIFELLEQALVQTQYGEAYFEGFFVSRRATSLNNWTDDWSTVEFAAEFNSKALSYVLSNAAYAERERTFMYYSGEINIRNSLEGKVELRIAPKIKDLFQAKILLAEFLDDMYDNYTV